MKMLTGNLAPSAGTVKICGIDIVENPKEAKALIGYLPEQPPLYRELTVSEFLALAARLHRVSGSHVKKAVQVAMERCGLTDMSKRLIENLSKGYQQRVGIAQAIIHNPMVVILDEPTVGLDPIQIRDIRTLIKELGGEHSVILSTHILPEVEMVCDHVQIIHKGQLVFNGSIEVLNQQRQGNKLLLGLNNPPARRNCSRFPVCKQLIHCLMACCACATRKARCRPKRWCRPLSAMAGDCIRSIRIRLRWKKYSFSSHIQEARLDAVSTSVFKGVADDFYYCQKRTEKPVRLAHGLGDTGYPAGGIRHLLFPAALTSTFKPCPVSCVPNSGSA